MNKKATLIIAAALMLVPAAAHADADRLRGLIADRCADCHLAPGFEDRAVEFGAPAFLDIAADPERFSREKLTVYLREPHWQMRQFILSPRDINDVIDYIETLR